MLSSGAPFGLCATAVPAAWRVCGVGMVRKIPQPTGLIIGHLDLFAARGRHPLDMLSSGAPLRLGTTAVPAASRACGSSATSPVTIWQTPCNVGLTRCRASPTFGDDAQQGCG